MNHKLHQFLQLLITGLVGDAGIAAFQAPTPNEVQQYGSLILQGLVTLVTIIAAIKKLRQPPVAPVQTLPHAESSK